MDMPVSNFQPFKLFGMSPLLYMIVVFAVALVFDQLLDGFITPRIMARALKVHPAAVLVSALVGADLLGILGIIIAAPMLATFFLFFRYTMRKMLDQDPWPDEEPPPPGGLPWAGLVDRLRARLSSLPFIKKSSPEIPEGESHSKGESEE